MRGESAFPFETVSRLLSPRRARHSQAVSRWARRLAERHGVDPDRAERAGWFHDVAKEWPRSRLRAYVRRNGIRVPGLEEILSRRRENLLHGHVSAHWAKGRGWVGDRSTLAAMARHTLGHPRMSPLDKVLYVADFSSPDRCSPEARRVRRLARRDLDGALRAAVAYKMGDVLRRSSFLHPATVALWNELCRGTR